jgi:hypothetical protein
VAALSQLTNFIVLSNPGYSEDLSYGNPPAAAARNLRPPSTANSFGIVRGQCSAGSLVATKNTYSLTLTQFSGIFLLLSFGAVASFMAKYLFTKRRLEVVEQHSRRLWQGVLLQKSSALPSPQELPDSPIGKNPKSEWRESEEMKLHSAQEAQVVIS